MTTDWQTVPVFGSPPPDDRATVRPSAYALASDRAGRLAVVRTPHGCFLPGGGIEAGESPDAAVVREMREECGLDATIGPWRACAVDFVYSTEEHRHFQKRSTFIGVTTHTDPVAAGEADHELKWLSSDEANAALSHPSHRWAAARWAEHRDEEQRAASDAAVSPGDAAGS